MKPSILFLNRVYPPTEGATGQLLAELAEELVQRGYAVTVITSRTSSKEPRSQIEAGVQVERVGGLMFSRASHLRRALSYLSLYPGMLWRAWRMPRHDLVVTLTDPPLQVLLGPMIKLARGSKVIHWAQDIYPELAEELGVLRQQGFIANILRGLSTWALGVSDGVVAVGHCMKRRLAERGLPAGLVTVISNWGHGGNAEGGVRSAELGNDAASFRVQHGLDGKFVVMYSGNLGLAHPFEAILDAVERLRISLPEVAFVFVGAGPRLAWVKMQVERRHLDNVRFVPFQLREQLTQSLAAADIHLASMRSELCGLVVPSKVFGVLAVGRPCIFLGPEESEAAQIILQQGCGSVLPNATGMRLAACLTQWVKHPESLREARLRAEAAMEKVGFPRAVEQFEKVFSVILERDLQQPLSPRVDERESEAA